MTSTLCIRRNIGVVVVEPEAKLRIEAFLWKIDDFWKLYEDSDCLVSPVFAEGWYLKLAIDSQQKHITLYLYNERDEDELASMLASAKFSLLAASAMKELTMPKVFRNCRVDDFWGYSTAFKLSFIKDHERRVLLDGAITFRCELTIYGGDGDDDSLQPNTQHHHDYLTDYEKLFESEQLCDVSFQVGEKKRLIRAHKQILVARSPVFKAMFTGDMREKSQSSVQIENVKYEVFQDMLRFLYCEKCKDMEAHPKELFIAADMYSIEKLKCRCEEVLFKGVSVSNSIELLRFADAYNSKGLKKRVMRFVVANSMEIASKPEFDKFGEEHPKLLVEVIKSLANALRR